MELCKITAIIRLSMLESVEKRLQELGVPGISVTKVKGYGEYANFFSRDWLVEHARLEIFLTQTRAHEIARAIMAAAHTGGAGDGLVVVLPVEAVYRIRTGEPARANELGGEGRHRRRPVAAGRRTTQEPPAGSEPGAS